jgi:hypothetical protein
MATTKFQYRRAEIKRKFSRSLTKFTGTPGYPHRAWFRVIQ